VQRERARSDCNGGGELSGVEDRSGARCRRGEEEMRQQRE